jgi:predicted DNA-binding ribbon-helix-helix protein
MAAKREMPIGGKRAKMGTGRARGRMLGVWIDDTRFATLIRIAEREGVTRTALIERWVDEHTTLADSASD